MCPTHGVLVLSCPSAALRVRSVPGLLVPVHRCARVVCCVVSAVSWATWLLFTSAPARCGVFRVRRPGPLGSRSPVCPLGVLCCVCGVLGHLDPVHRCSRSVCCFGCAMSWPTWPLFTVVPAPFVVLCLRFPGPLGSCSPVRPLGVLLCVRGVLGHLAPVHQCACSIFCFVCAVSWAPWLLFSGVTGGGVPSLCCPRCTCVWGVLALVAPVHRCACCVRCACAVGGCVPLPPPLIFVVVFFFSLKWKKRRAHVHCRQRHGQLVQRCNSVVSYGVCRRYLGGGRAPGVQLARPDVHGYGSGWVWLGALLLLVLVG